MSLFYLAVANSKNIICTYCPSNRNFSECVHQYLSKNLPEGHHYYLQDLPPPNASRVGVHGLNISGICFVAITSAETPRQQPVQFLVKVAENFASSSERVNQAKNGSANCLQNAYGATLSKSMSTFEQCKTNQQMSALQANVEGVTNQLKENVRELMRRGDMASSLAEKTADMESDARMFETYSKKVEQKKRCQHLRMKFIIIGVVVLILAVIILIILWQTGVFNKH